VQVALLRVGIDSGCGGMQGPLFQDKSFEYLPIPDDFDIDDRTYGNTPGRKRGRLVEYFPESRREKMGNKSIHLDPEFSTFTYGDPTPPKAGLRNLQSGDLLVFYCGLEGWDFFSPPALYIMGYFEILRAGKALSYSTKETETHFGANFHVKHREIYEEQKNNLVLVEGSGNSRLLEKAVCISEMGNDRSGRPLKVLSKEMQKIFGDFDGKISIQRSPTRWVKPEYVDRAAEYVKSL
jgi:hypothetical protein